MEHQMEKKVRNATYTNNYHIQKLLDCQLRQLKHQIFKLTRRGAVDSEMGGGNIQPQTFSACCVGCRSDWDAFWEFFRSCQKCVRMET